MKVMPEQTNLEKRTGCIASAMKIIGNKWTALILRDLSNGPKRFRDFSSSIPTLNPRTLTLRLRDLEDQKIITSCQKGGGYELTKKGQALIPVLRAMADWGERYS